MPTSGLSPYDAERFRRHTTVLLFVLVVLVVGILGVSMFGIYNKVADTQEQIQNAIEEGPENTTHALCEIFVTFDQLSKYHGFPPATDKATRQACAELGVTSD